MSFPGDDPFGPSHNWEFRDYRKNKDPKRGMPAWLVVAFMIAIAITVKILHDNGYF